MNCRKSTRLLSEERDRELSPAERAEVDAHLAICPACTRCQRQFEALGEAMRRIREP